MRYGKEFGSRLNSENQAATSGGCDGFSLAKDSASTPFLFPLSKEVEAALSCGVIKNPPTASW
jgi:hypothetical protein